LIAALGDQGALAIAGAILPVIAVATWGSLRRVDADVVVPERQVELLRGVALFAPLPLTALERLAEALRTVHAPAGDTIVREGEPGRDYYLVVDGEVEVRAGGRTVARARAGDGFGEIALLRDVPRTATVVAVTDVELAVLGPADFLAAVAGPSSAAAAAAVMDERLARVAIG
jgi:CRP-like cAMP-binding protein